MADTLRFRHCGGSLRRGLKHYEYEQTALKRVRDELSGGFYAAFALRHDWWLGFLLRNENAEGFR